MTLLIVRHADRVPNQDALSGPGVTRAQELVHVVQKGGISGVYHSDTMRTRQTAEPTATTLSVPRVEIPAAEVEALIQHIEANHPRGATVLVVGHSNTVPQIIARAGGPTIPDLADNEFDNLFVLERCTCRWWGAAKLVNLQYGLPSP